MSSSVTLVEKPRLSDLVNIDQVFTFSDYICARVFINDEVDLDTYYRIEDQLYGIATLEAVKDPENNRARVRSIVTCVRGVVEKNLNDLARSLVIAYINLRDMYELRRRIWKRA